MHTGEHTQNYVMEDILALLDSPARSSDLNPIENLWALLVRTVFAGFRQFENEEDLIEAIQYAWINRHKAVQNLNLLDTREVHGSN